MFDLCTLSDKYGIQSLFTFCKALLSKKEVTIESLEADLCMSEAHKIAELLDKSMQFITENWEELSKSGQLDELMKKYPKIVAKTVMEKWAPKSDQ